VKEPKNQLAFQKRLRVDFWGEGLLCRKLAAGHRFYSCVGTLKQVALGPNQKLKVDTVSGRMSSSVRYDIKYAGKLKRVCLVVKFVLCTVTGLEQSGCNHCP